MKSFKKLLLMSLSAGMFFQGVDARSLRRDREKQAAAYSGDVVIEEKDPEGNIVKTVVSAKDIYDGKKSVLPAGALVALDKDTTYKGMTPEEQITFAKVTLKDYVKHLSTGHPFLAAVGNVNKALVSAKGPFRKGSLYYNKRFKHSDMKEPFWIFVQKVWTNAKIFKDGGAFLQKVTAADRDSVLHRLSVFFELAQNRIKGIEGKERDKKIEADLKSWSQQLKNAQSK